MRAGFMNVDHMFLADVLGPGISMVTGGDYSRSNLPKGYWGVVSDSVLVGQTQATSPNDAKKYNFASGGPLGLQQQRRLLPRQGQRRRIPAQQLGHRPASRQRL